MIVRLLVGQGLHGQTLAAVRGRRGLGGAVIVRLLVGQALPGQTLAAVSGRRGLGVR